jgi:gliding motility-associated-like protein
MTLTRSITIACLCILLFRVGYGQHQDPLAGSVQLTTEQLVVLDSLATDSTGGVLAVPNVFTPNGDGVNDYFEVTTDGIRVYDFNVFTRTGTRVFHSLSPRIFWDGKSNTGKDLQAGVYYYLIEEQDDPEPFEEAGFMHLFR